MELSVVIPVYKNTELFLTNLKRNMRFLKKTRVIIVNDNPAESLKKKLSTLHAPNLSLIEHTRNMGFGQTVNDGFAETESNLVLLLNSDVVLLDDSFRKTSAMFQKNNRLFAVSFAQKEQDGRIVGKNRMFWSRGFLSHAKRDKLFPGINAWAEGGSCIIDRKKFRDLGGFDSMYAPFYWEDIDLSYRAWKSGYEIYFEPSILVEHHHESTISKYFGSHRIKTIAFRNQFLFIWKNIDNLFFLLEHFMFLPYYLLRFLMKMDLDFFRGFIQAIALIPKIKKKRYTISDNKVLKTINHE